MMKMRSISADILYSILAVIVYFLIMFLAFHNPNPFSYLENDSVISSLIIIITSILGVIAIIITLFTVFENAFEDNKIIKVLKARNDFVQIYKRYSDSIFVMFFAIIIIIIIWITSNSLKSFEIYLLPIMAVAIVISFVRMYRCFKIFKLLNDAISVNK